MKPPLQSPRHDTGLGPGRGLAAASPGRGLEIGGAILSLVWVALVLTSPSGDEGGALGLLMTLLMLLLPVALIWVLVVTLRFLRDLRAEAAELQAALNAMRSGDVQAQAQPAAKPVVERRAGETAAIARQAGTVPATFTSRRDAALTVPSADRKAALVKPAPEPAAEQAALALGTPPEDNRPPISIADFIRALNFPETPDDKEGFRALRLALEDRTVAKLIRASQDVLTLLSQDGIYMDDLTPDLARPDLWRRFAAGERGRSIAGLGGIRDRDSLDRVSRRMKSDLIFRDAAHHFLRAFDKTFSAFEPNASDAELTELGDTRTARAFMLLGRVTGTFD